ncbi:unnamed protein product [Spirodela intermedia]|uniref:CCT domain-containing protein n=1 Tax=Spirodela intermedia TaxID=51605 RepID=A0A7I8IY79_SPIIN|nr:unnamed protein product [Spirodela intermedia]CAA6662533.1 unnamed protein product [Spirodela intermedia]
MASLNESSFKVGRLSIEERQEKINRYMKKRNERNFSKKIKYACRKTLADSRPASGEIREERRVWGGDEGRLQQPRRRRRGRGKLPLSVPALSSKLLGHFYSGRRR